MAEPERHPTAAAGPDLHAQIRARVAERRRGGAGDSVGHLSVAEVKAAHSDPQPSRSTATSLNGRPPVTALPPATALPLATDRTSGAGQHSRPGQLRPVTDGFDRATATTATTASLPTVADAVVSAGLPGRTGGAASPALGNRSGRGRHGAAPAPPGLLRRLARLAMLLVLTAAAVVGLRSYVVASYYIPSASMETTLHGCPGCQPDMVLVDKLSYRVKSISRTDVVVFNRPPLAPPADKQLIKRVIGLPGEVVSGHGGHVYIGDRELIEPYLNPACQGTADFAPVTVPAGHYFMMGDNRCDSFDSRMFGAIPRSAVVGRAFAVIWPMKHLRWL